ncbi:MAG TPA: polymer-forming cytoskeletal protein [Candidatus Dormibacteraeota bacterium]
MSASSQRGGITLGPNDRLIGELHIDGDVRLGGTVQGEIHASGDVEVDDAAKVNASLAGGDINIRGSVSGPVTARKRLVVARSGSLTGDVRVARLVIQDGATFSGNVSMGPQPDAFALPQEAPVASAAPEPAKAAAPDAPAMPQPARDDGKAKGKQPKR